ncbi:MAG: ferredoxin [Oscillospiraceae bacterium]
MKVKIDRDGCIGCGLCAATCPEVFRMADDGAGGGWRPRRRPDVEDGAKEAADNCPVQVIETGRLTQLSCGRALCAGSAAFTVQK